MEICQQCKHLQQYINLTHMQLQTLYFDFILCVQRNRRYLAHAENTSALARVYKYANRHWHNVSYKTQTYTNPRCGGLWYMARAYRGLLKQHFWDLLIILLVVWFSIRCTVHPSGSPVLAITTFTRHVLSILDKILLLENDCGVMV